MVCAFRTRFLSGAPPSISVRTPAISIESRVSRLSYLGSHLGETGLELVEVTWGAVLGYDPRPD